MLMNRKPKTLPFKFMVAALFIVLNSGIALSEEKKENLVWDAGAVQLEYAKLAPGVYAYYPTDASEKNPKGYPVATSGGFVVGDKEVLVVESMVNKRLAN